MKYKAAPRNKRRPLTDNASGAGSSQPTPANKMEGQDQINTVNCERCGRRCQVSVTRREDSAPFRRSIAPKGVCPDCVMTEWLYNTYPVNMILDRMGAERLRHPIAREAFIQSGILTNCEMDISELNWDRIVDNWNLPVRQKRGPRDPYTMGDDARLQAELEAPKKAEVEFEVARADLIALLRNRAGGAS